MRGYLAVTPEVLGNFLRTGTHNFSTAYATTRYFFEEHQDVDEEEREFELSWLAALDSKEQQGSEICLGFVLAVDLRGKQTGNEVANTIELVSELSWMQVESLLVSDNSEAELTWYANQEVEELLPQWVQ